MNASLLKKRKSLLALLLSGCTVAALLLLLIPPPQKYLLEDLGTLDRLITQSFADHGIPPGRLQVRATEVDSLLTRRDYSIQLARSFPATRVHIAIAQGAYPYGVQVKGRYNQDETALHLTLSYRNTLLRTLEMRFSDSAEPLIPSP
ncbi:hypothetical protein CYPRO_2951 [Cyclonatronum proteinivorum]|uniref:Uncharacterized protein n=1 Tax=Cyclonatronum proteinivorum TaxID=1457365 RepID=A0A345UNY6_9BACT|nr:hypothetical protein [Cyclonatronum proteinivorum]AXJ02188.1 hypothetical protein CYPRO_2951 [Cyclonatronum proteinivorum]